MEDFNLNPAESATGPQTAPNGQQAAPAAPVAATPPVSTAPKLPDYQLDTVTDAQGVQAVLRAMSSPLFRVGYWVLAVLCLVLGILLILLDQQLTLLNATCLLLGLLIIFLRLYLPKQIARRQMKVIRESYGSDSVPVHLVFWPQGVVVNNTISGAHQNIRYDIIKKLFKLKDYLVLQTQAGQSVILPLADLDSQPDLVPYLLAKCPQAKKKGF